MSRKFVIVVFIFLLAGWSTAQAFGFCFNFGGGGKNHAGVYNRPPPAIGFGPGVYNYPYSPVAPAPYFAPYYAAPRAPDYPLDRTPGPLQYR